MRWQRVELTGAAIGAITTDESVCPDHPFDVGHVALLEGFLIELTAQND